MPRAPSSSRLAALVGLLGIVGVAGASGPRTAAAESRIATMPRRERPSAVLSDDGRSGAELPSVEPLTPTPASDDRWPARNAARLADLEATPRPAPEPAPTDLVAALEAIARTVPPSTRLGVAVRDLDTGATVFEWDGDEALNPASNHKLLTATAAVALLGGDYRFETEVARSGDTLYLVGHGDPSLQVEDLAALAERVAAGTELSGVRRVVVDDHAFTSRRFGPGYDADGPGYSYLAPSGALSLQFNTVMIEVRPGTPGQAPDVRVEPSCEHVVVANEAVTGRGRLGVRTVADGDHTVVEVSGAISRRDGTFRIRRRITDPGRFAGTTFAGFLQTHGAGPLVVERGLRPDDAARVAVHGSAPLTEVLDSALKFSNNFTTEQILRTLGHRATGDPGDWDNGAATLRAFWTAAGLPAEAIEFENGSGFSRHGRVTPRALVQLLAVAQREARRMMEAMPVAGREGTLRGRLRHTGGRVRAKTGTLRDASGLTGVITTGDGRARLGFSILVNAAKDGRSHARVDPTRAHRIQDRFVRTLVAHLRR